MPAFEKSSMGWQSVTHFSRHDVKWTVAFDGKNFGQVGESSALRGRWCRPDKLEVIPSEADRFDSPAEVPTVGKPSQRFTGITALFGLATVRRPLVVVSEPFYRDPDGWKKTQLPEEIARLVREGYRRQYPHLDRCKDEKIAERNWQFPDSALTFPAAYGSNKNSFLVAVSLNAGDCSWGGRPDDPLDSFVHQSVVLCCRRPKHSQNRRLQRAS